MPTIDYTNKDFNSYYQMFLNLIKQEFPTWTDLNKSNLGVALAKFISMIGDGHSFYQDQFINQMMLPTATLRKYVLLGCKKLGYKPYAAKPSTVSISFTIEAKAVDYIIPVNYPVGTTDIDDKGNYIRFETDEALTITAGLTNGTVSATQGETIENEFLGVSDGSLNQMFILDERNVIDSSISIEVYHAGVPTTWTEVESLAGMLDTEKFESERDEVDRCYILFGDGINGKIPVSGDEIYVTYRIGGGEDTNVGIGTITENKGILSDLTVITNAVAATGGTDRETDDSAKSNAKIHFRNSGKAITQEDYDSIPLLVSGVKRCKAAYQVGDTIYLYIAADNDTGIPSAALKSAVEAYIDDKQIITFNCIAKDPYIVYVDITLSGQINPEFYRSDVESEILTSLRNLFSIQSKDFGDIEQLGKVYREVVSIEELEYIEISQLTTRPIVYEGTQNADPRQTFDTITVLSTNTLAGHWKVTMTDATHFDVTFYDVGSSMWIAKGSGEFDIEFTSSGSEIKFTITSGIGVSQAGDYWEFYTNKYFGNITIVNSTEILLAGTITVTLTGGLP